MRALVRTSPRLPSGFLLKALNRAFERTVGAAVVYMIEYRKAKAAEACTSTFRDCRTRS